MIRSRAGVVALAWALSGAAAAQPAGRPAMAEIVRGAKWGKGVTCTPVDPGKVGSEKKLYQNTRTKEVVTKHEYWLAQSVKCKDPAAIPGFPKAYRMWDGTANFTAIGGGWQWSSWFAWDSWLEGMPDPDVAALTVAIEDKSAVIRHFFLQKITRFHSYGIKPKARVLWVETTKLKTEVEAVVDIWDAADLVKSQMVFDVEFWRDSPTGPWKAHGAEPKQTELSRRTPSQEEARSLVSVLAQEDQAAAAAKLAALPVVEVPTFATYRQAQLFIYKLLRESPRPELESYLRRMYSTLKEDELTAALALQPQFKGQYCACPTFKDNNYGFVNKDGSSWTSIKLSQEGGEFKEGKKVNQLWKITELSLGIVKGEKLAAQQSYAKDLCDLTLPKASGQGEWHACDQVQVKEYSTAPWSLGTVGQIKDGKAWIEYGAGGKGYFTPEAMRDPGSPDPEPTAAPKAAPVAAAPAPAPVEAALPYAIGDRIEGNVRGRWFKGKVKGFNSRQDKVFILFDDKTSEYLPFDKVHKE